MVDKIYTLWLEFIDSNVVPFLRSKLGMYIVLGLILWILIY